MPYRRTMPIGHHTTHTAHTVTNETDRPPGKVIKPTVIISHVSHGVNMTANANTVNAEQRNIILNAVCDAINKGYGVVPRQPLSKRNVKGYGPEQAIRNIKTVTDRWSRDSGYNYGVIVDGFMVVDVDGNQGLEDLARLENEHGFALPRDFALPSPGGLHIFLPYRTGCSLNGHLKVGSKKTAIEVFQWNQGEAGKPRIVTGPGSILENGEYTGTLPDMSQLFAIEVPQAFADLVSDQARSSNIYPIRSDRPDYVVGAGRGNEEVGEEDLYARITARDVEEMLSVIPADISGGGEYGDWFKVTAGLANYFNDSEEYDAVKDLWFAWRRRDPDGYRDSDDGRLDSLAKDTGNDITIGSVIYIAKEYGYQAPKNVQHRSILEEINDKYRFALVKGQAKFVYTDNRGRMAMSNVEDLRKKYSNKEVFVGGKFYNPIDLLMKWEGRHNYEGVEFIPPGFTGDAPENAYNLWTGWRVDPQPGDIPEFLELIERMVPHKDSREFLLDFIADIFQNPGHKPPTAIIMRSTKGAGKGMLFSLICSAMKMAQYSVVGSSDELLGRFNGWMITALAAMLDEAVWSGSKKEENKLKSLIGNPIISVDEKNIPSVTMHNFTRFFVFSNEDWVIPTDDEERRYFVLNVPKAYPEGDSHWNQLGQLRDNQEHAAQLLNYFLGREITHNMRNPPKTEEFYRQSAETKIHRYSKGGASSKHNQYINTLVHIIEDGLADYITTGDLVCISSNRISQVHSRINDLRAVNRQEPKLFANWCKDVLGLELEGNRSKVNGVTVRGWIMTRGREELADLIYTRLGVDVSGDGDASWDLSMPMLKATDLYQRPNGRAKDHC